MSLPYTKSITEVISMELRHIRYFKAVAEELNFTRAAEKLSIAQPPLSRQIQDLEQDLGTKLFVRNPHKISLTREGELFLQYANQILDLVSRSEEEVREVKEGLQGTLYIASVEGYGPKFFAETISSFQQKYPHVQYNLWNGNTDDVNARVSKGLCEIAMITAPYNKEGFEVLPVHQESWVAIFPKDHPLAQNVSEPLTPEELLPYELLIPSRESRKSEIDHWFTQTGKAPTIRGRIAHMMNAYELSRHGVGVAIYPASISYMIKHTEVCLRQIDHPKAFASYALIWDKNRQLSRVAEEFIAHVKSTKQYSQFVNRCPN